jgi:hypothetical protein
MVGRTRDFWIKGGGKSGLAELSFLVPPSSLAKTHKNGLLAVYVHACLERHLVECFVRLSPSSTLTHCTLCLLLQLCRVFALPTYSTCSSFNFFFFFFRGLCNLLWLAAASSLFLSLHSGSTLISLCNIYLLLFQLWFLFELSTYCCFSSIFFCSLFYFLEFFL